MDKLNTLISLNDAKKTIDELIAKLKHNGEELAESSNTRKILIITLTVIGALAVIGAIAYAVYRHFSDDGYDYNYYPHSSLDDDDEDMFGDDGMFDDGFDTESSDTEDATDGE